MATTIRISGVDINRLFGSLQISGNIECRPIASFVVVDEPGTASYSRGQAVDIFEGIAIPPFIHPLFNGYIETPRKKRIATNSNSLYWTIDCIGNHYLADKCMAAETYVGQTAGFIVTDLWTKYLQPEGITLGIIDVGPVFPEVIINYRSVSDALDNLAERSDKIWCISKAKELYFIDRSTVPAPFAITASDIIRDPGITSEMAEAAPLYRNRQYIRAGRATTTLQHEGKDGDANWTAMVLGYPLHSEPVITMGGGGQSVGIKGIDVGYDWYWGKGDPIIVADAAPPGGFPGRVEVDYYGEYDIIVMVDSIPQQLARQAVEGGTGITAVIDNRPSINDKDDALETAKRLLEHYGIVGKQFSFAIRRWGLEPGQLVTITHAAYGLTADELLVESVDISEIAPDELRYDIRAVEGPEMGDWTGFFKHLADIKYNILERVVIGPDQVLIVLVQATGEVEVSETFNVDAYACTLCNGTPCGDGVLVC